MQTCFSGEDFVVKVLLDGGVMDCGCGGGGDDDGDFTRDDDRGVGDVVVVVMKKPVKNLGYLF